MKEYPDLSMLSFFTSTQQQRVPFQEEMVLDQSLKTTGAYPI